jgi:hypothetical protein
MRISLVIGFLVGASGGASAWAQIVNPNAGTTSPETPIWQNRLEYRKAAHLTDVELEEKFFWAPNNAMDFAINVPLMHRDVEFGSGAAGTLEGLGDLSVEWKYSFYKENEVMQSTRLSSLLGVTLPTGPFHEHLDGALVPQKMQLGTGAVGIYGGPLFTAISDRQRVAAEVVGTYNTQRDGFQLQPSARLGLSYWYRISPATIETAGQSTEIRGVLEITSIFFGESRLGGRGLGDRGNITWLSPGLQVYPAAWSLFEVSIQIPIFQDVHDVIGNQRYGVLFSFKFLF